LLHFRYFFNVEPTTAFLALNARDGVHHFLKVNKTAWKSDWSVNKTRSVRPAQKFILYLIQRHIIIFNKRYKKYFNRKRWVTKKKKVGGLDSNPICTPLLLNARIMQMLISWLTISHLGLGSIIEAEKFAQWPNAEKHVKPVLKSKMVMTYMRVASSGGAGGIVYFSDKPRFKHLLNLPRWDWNMNRDLDDIELELNTWIADEENHQTPVIPDGRTDFSKW